MKDADLGLDTVPTACLEDLLNDCMNLMVMSSSDVTSNASLDTWHLTESCTIPGTMKEDVERSLLDILERYYPGWARNLGQHCGEKVMKDQDSVQQWAHALCTYLSWDEYCQMTTAQLTLQYQEEMADLLMQNPRMSSLARNMDAATMEAIRQMARGRNIEPSDAMKFLHSLVVTASKAARDKEMDHIVHSRRMNATLMPEEMEMMHPDVLTDMMQQEQLQAVNKTVQLEMELRRTTMDMVMADRANRSERNLREPMKVWVNVLSPSLSKHLLRVCHHAASMMVSTLLETQSLGRKVQLLMENERGHRAVYYEGKMEESMVKFAQYAERFLATTHLWHLLFVVSKSVQ